LGISKNRTYDFEEEKILILPMPTVSYSFCSALIVDSINAFRDAYCGVFCR
jgi:hypothetical protein